MILFRERLSVPAWMYLATALVIPAALIVFAPINFGVGVGCAIVLYGAIVFALLAGAPTLVVTDAEFRAGRATIEREFVGEAEAFTGTAARDERGPRLDARAWLLLRGGIPVVKVPVTDPADPVPYWLVSTRRPHELAETLNAQQGAAGPAAS